MTDQPVTPDREALEQANGALPRREFVMLLWRYGPTMDPDVAGRLADRFLAAGWLSPEQVADALDRARRECEQLRAEASLLRADVTILRAGAIPITDEDLDHFESGRQQGRDEMTAALADAVEGMDDMIGYVPDYFREKWGHDAFLARGRAALARGGPNRKDEE